MKLPEIPSEFIEPYAQKFLSQIIEAVGIGMTKPEQARVSLKEVERFICRFSGIHARLAVSNEYNRFCTLDDKTMVELCQQAVKETEYCE